MAVAVQQVLQELSDLVPVVPPRVAEVLEAGEALQERMSEVRDRVAALKPLCAQVDALLSAVLREAVEQDEQDARDCQERVEEYGDRKQDLEEAAREAQEQLQAAGAQAKERVKEVYEAAAADGRLSRYEQRQANLARRNADLARRRRQALEGMLESLRRRQDDIVAALGAAHDAVRSECERLAERVEERQRDTAAHLEQLESRTRRAIELMGGGLDGSGGLLDEGGAAALDGLRTVLGGQGGGAVLGPGELLQSIVGRVGLGAALAAAQAEAQDAAREAFEPLFEGVSLLLDPVQGALGAIRGAASMVGLATE